MTGASSAEESTDIMPTYMIVQTYNNTVEMEYNTNIYIYIYIKQEIK